MSQHLLDLPKSIIFFQQLQQLLKSVIDDIVQSFADVTVQYMDDFSLIKVFKEFEHQRWLGPLYRPLLHLLHKNNFLYLRIWKIFCKNLLVFRELKVSQNLIVFTSQNKVLLIVFIELLLFVDGLAGPV